MTEIQKIVLIALVVLAGLAIVVTLVLGHHIGGFLRTVEREAREEAEARERERAAGPDAPDRPSAKEE